MSRSQTSPDTALRRRLDAVVARLAASRRTFTEDEALAEVWKAGYNVSPQDDERFVLGREADGRSPRHWHLAGQVVANNRLIEALEAATWDGRDLDGELARLDGEHGGHHLFCPADDRLTVHPDGRVELAEERDPPSRAGVGASEGAWGLASGACLAGGLRRRRPRRPRLLGAGGRRPGRPRSDEADCDPHSGRGVDGWGAGGRGGDRLRRGRRPLGYR
jgi:hypothetical protein